MSYQVLSPKVIIYHRIYNPSGSDFGELGRAEQVNLLAIASDWAWPQAVRQIFEPRGVNLLLAGSIDEFIVVLGSRRIHAAIIDLDSQSCGLTAIRVIRMGHPVLPCLILKSRPDESAVGPPKAEGLQSAIGGEKPVSARRRKVFSPPSAEKSRCPPEGGLEFCSRQLDPLAADL